MVTTQWHLGGICSGVIASFCTFLFICLTFLSGLFHPPLLSVCQVLRTYHDENTRGAAFLGLVMFGREEQTLGHIVGVELQL